jgi:hypothetical protein
MTDMQRTALCMAVQRFIREGKEPTEAGIRNALTFQGVPDDQAQQQAASILAEAKQIVDSEVQP